MRYYEQKSLHMAACSRVCGWLGPQTKIWVGLTDTLLRNLALDFKLSPKTHQRTAFDNYISKPCV